MLLLYFNSYFLYFYILNLNQYITTKHELLLVAESIKILYSSWMISKNLASSSSSSSEEDGGPSKSLSRQLMYLISTSRKMFVLALIYGVMNILSFVSLRNISAGMFTIFAQCKILTTATFSTIMLKRQYSWTKWRALIALMMGVLLFSAPIWDGDSAAENPSSSYGNPFIGTAAVLIEVTLSGFASIYFEKVIKTDTLQLGIWERNFQLALGSFPVYIVFIIADGISGSTHVGFFGGWSWLTCLLSALGAAGGLLVALSIKYGDSILKTLATTGAIVLTGVLDHLFLGGPLTPSMMIAGVQVIIAICNYTFDASPAISMPDLNNAIAATTTTTTTDLNTAAGSLPSKSMLKSSRTSSTSIPSGDGTMTMTRGDNNDESSRSSNSNSNSSNKNETEKLIRRS